MSGVESPFHAIAAQALDDTADEAFVIPVVTSSEVGVHKRDSSKAAANSHTEDGSHESGRDALAGGEAEEDAALIEEPQADTLAVFSGGGADSGNTVTRRSKKRPNVWATKTSRKSTKRGNGRNGGVRVSVAKDESLLLKPFHHEDDPTYPILLSKVYKAEKIELSGDRLSASGSRGYRMVRATRGVVEGAWYFEISIEKLGETGHTRLGWSTRRGDIQAPVGYDAHSYAYKDIDGKKVHAARPEEYGEPYRENDVIGFYINLPREAGFARKAEEVVGYKGQAYVIVPDEPLKPLPGSEIIIFKNGVCQGVAFKDINDGTYFPAASLYTLPSQDFCTVAFNFGPEFKYPVTDLGDRPFPSPMSETSGPGPRAEIVPACQIEIVTGPDDDSGGNQEMTADVAGMEGSEGGTTPTEETTPKRIGKLPVVKKKVKIPNPPGVGKLSTLLKKTQPGEVCPNSGFKRVSDIKDSKKDATGVGLMPPGLSTKKRIEKDMSGMGRRGEVGAGLSYLKGDKKPSSMSLFPNLKGGKKDETNARLADLEGSKRDIIRTELPVNEGRKKDMIRTDLPSFKGKKRAMTGTVLTNSKVSRKDTVGAEWMSPKGSRDNITTESPSLHRTNKDTFEAVAPSSKTSRMDTFATAAPSSKGSRMDTFATVPPSSKGSKMHTFAGISPGSKGSKMDTFAAVAPGSKGSRMGPFTAVTPSSKGSKMVAFAAGPPSFKRGKLDVSKTGPSFKASRDFTGKGTGLKVSNDFTGKVSALKVSRDFMGKGPPLKASKTFFTGTGFGSTGFGPSAFGSRRGWEEGIQGGLDVDVVVVESSTPFHTPVEKSR